MADLATKDQDRPPTLSITPDKLEPLSQAQMDAVDTSDGRPKQSLAGGGVLPRGSSPTEQALGLDSQTSAYGVKARQLQQDQLNATKTANAAGDARNERYLRMMEDQYKATGLQQGELPKWDAKKEREQFQTDPIQAFGSMASVFGILASAFTHAPLTNALNASSAAMNAIRQGDEKGYNEAFDAWKENTLLTYKRHEVEQQRFNDATRLLDTNWKLGEAKMRATAVEFGMQSELAMMDSGMWPELFKLQQSKMDSAAGMLRASDTLTNERFKNDLFKQWESAADEEFKGDPNKQAGARLSFAMARNAINSSSPEWQTIGNQVGQWQAQVMHNEKRIPTTEEVSAKIRELKEATTGRAPARENVDQEWLRLWDDANRGATAEDRSEAFSQHLASKRPARLTADQKAEEASKITAAREQAKAANRPLTMSDLNAGAFKTIWDTVAQEHPDWSPEQAVEEARRRYTASGKPTPETADEKVELERRKAEARQSARPAPMTADERVDLARRTAEARQSAKPTSVGSINASIYEAIWKGLKEQHPEMSNDQLAVEARRKFSEAARAQPAPKASDLKRQFMQDFADAARREHPDWPPDRVDQEALSRYESAATGKDQQGKLTIDRQISGMMAEKRQALQDEGVPRQDANTLATSYAAELRARATPLPQNRADDLRRLASMDNRAIDEIDTLDRMMKQNSAITGALGRARRAGESLTGLLGGNADQAKLFRERLITLRHWVSQLIDNRVTAGRPLSSQEAQITAMAPGLDLGDNPHYVRDTLGDLRKTLASMSKENQERIDKSFAPGPPPAKGGARSGVPLWQRGTPSPVGAENGTP